MNFFFFFLQINLRLILVSGKTKEYLFSPNESAGDIAQYVFDNWPSGDFFYELIIDISRLGFDNLDFLKTDFFCESN